MITLLYRGIVALVLLLVCCDLFSEKKFVLQLNAALVLIPLVLRLLMIQ